MRTGRHSVAALAEQPIESHTVLRTTGSPAAHAVDLARHRTQPTGPSTDRPRNGNQGNQWQADPYRRRASAEERKRRGSWYLNFILSCQNEGSSEGRAQGYCCLASEL